ncbi:hypothetical protein [Morganella morganii]|uniref:hypothetical protein n=1 Tax=Morganella morganii TaxID=582 RepID=UPI000A9C6488|nr:hypothetical protein [Morganella morganii]
MIIKKVEVFYGIAARTGKDILTEDALGKEMREIKLAEMLQIYLSNNESDDLDDSMWIKDDVLVIENYMGILEIGFLIKNHERINKGKTLQVVFEGDV